MQVVAATSTKTVGPEDYIDHYANPFDLGAEILKLASATQQSGYQNVAQNKNKSCAEPSRKGDDENEDERVAGNRKASVASDRESARSEDMQSAVEELPDADSSDNEIVIKRATTLGGNKIAFRAKSVDWTKYEPPAALREMLDVPDEELVEVVNSSLERLKEENTEAEKTRLEEEAEKARRRAAEEEGKIKEPYLPIIIPEPKPEPTPDTDELPETDEPRGDKGKGKDVDLMLLPPAAANGLVVLPFGPRRSRKKSAFARLLQKLERNDPDRGESSSAGARRRLFARLQAQQQQTLTSDSQSLVAPAVPSRRLSATSALVVQLELPKTPEPALIECVSCLDEFLAEDLVMGPCHAYCFDCFTRLISSATQHEQHWPPKCCLNEISFNLIRKSIFDDQLKATFEERALEWSVPISERIYCNQPDCGLWIKPGQVNHTDDSGTCDNGHTLCIMCRGALHEGEDCPQDRDLRLTNELAEEEGWKRCISCHALVEHREACQHMTCRCGAEFCYVCTARWRTCTCTMDQLNAVKAEAARRREARQRREREEAEELQQMLREIEEFEREEALKQVLLRQEQERREREERRRVELARREQVRDKFRRLRDVLEDLHVRQGVLLRSRLEDERKSLMDEALAAWDDLAAKHDSERGELRRVTEAKIAQRKGEFETEMARRVAQEKELEDRYRSQLEEFYADESDAEEKVAQMLRGYQHKMDKGFRQWRAHRDAELREHADRVSDKHTIREELMYSARQRLMDSYDEREAELERRAVAEARWFDEAVARRIVMLESMSAAEYAAGETDSLFSDDDIEEGEEEASSVSEAAETVQDETPEDAAKVKSEWSWVSLTPHSLASPAT